MLKKLLFIFLVVCFQQSIAQMPVDWGAFNQRVDVTNYTGKNFKIEAAVKVKTIDSTAEGEIWARIDKTDKKMGFFYNMMNKPIRLNEWKVYSISGRIDKNAMWLYFGGLYSRKGIFYFDDFKLSIETEKNKWQQIDLPDAGFESDTAVINKTWVFMQKRNGFNGGVTSDDFFKGQRSFKVDGSSFVAAKAFGNNPDAGKYAEVNGIKIYYETYGGGEPLLLLHGNRSSISLFQKQIPAFEKHFKVIAVDSRGQGKSTEDGRTYTYDLFAEDMNALLDHLGLDSVNIVGWSDGGNTGLIMAMKYPKKVRRLVTMGANVFIDKTVVDKWVFKEVEKQLKEFSRDTFPDSKNNYRLADLLLKEPNHSFVELKTIKCPVLVMAGEKDVIKEDHTKGIAANIPNSTLMIVPKATHEFPSEDPAAFNRAVIDFLEKK